MDKQEFNLVTDPWIKILDAKGKTQTVSMLDVFENAVNYRAFAGEMPTQDAIILRFLEAILTTVYSRLDSDDNPYSWVKLDETLQVTDFNNQESISDDLFVTWKKLYANNKFSNAVKKYLLANKNKFDFSHLYQVDLKTYNKLVNKKIDVRKTTGSVSVRQINRTISESNNSPAIFSPKSNKQKDETSLDELIRWNITYENAAGVSDKIKATKGSISAGWYYKLSSIYIEGQNLFQTLMLNLVLNTYKGDYRLERPIWEFDDMGKYIDYLNSISDISQESISFLYTLSDRLFHIEWKNDTPTIYVAGLKGFSNTDSFNEPMAIWTYNKISKSYYSAPVSLDQLERKMWWDFDKIIPSENNCKTLPGIIKWLMKIAEIKNVSTSVIRLRSSNLISDGKPMSQLPDAEYDQTIMVPTYMFIDSTWSQMLQKMISTIKIIRKDYWVFINELNKLRGSDDIRIANRSLDELDYHLNQAIVEWLRSLNQNSVTKDQLKGLFDKIKKILSIQGEYTLKNAGSRDIRGIKDEDDEVVNIFVLFNRFTSNYRRHLDL